MAISENNDYIFIPNVMVIMLKAFFIGTKDYFYVIPDEIEVNRGFLTEVLSNEIQVESYQINGKSLREYIAELLIDDKMTLDELHSFFTELKKKWEAITIFNLHRLKKLKVKGSILVKKEGDLGYTAVLTSMPKEYKKPVKEFYTPIVEKINQKKSKIL